METCRDEGLNVHKWFLKDTRVDFYVIWVCTKLFWDPESALKASNLPLCINLQLKCRQMRGTSLLLQRLNKSLLHLSPLSDRVRQVRRTPLRLREEGIRVFPRNIRSNCFQEGKHSAGWFTGISMLLFINHWESQSREGICRKNVTLKIPLKPV